MPKGLQGFQKGHITSEETRKKIGKANRVSVKKFYDNGGINSRKGIADVLLKCIGCGCKFTILKSRLNRGRTYCSRICKDKNHPIWNKDRKEIRINVLKKQSE